MSLSVVVSSSSTHSLMSYQVPSFSYWIPSTSCWIALARMTWVAWTANSCGLTSGLAFERARDDGRERPPGQSDRRGHAGDQGFEHGDKVGRDTPATRPPAGGGVTARGARLPRPPRAGRRAAPCPPG